MDEVGIDLADRVTRITRPAFGDRMRRPGVARLSHRRSPRERKNARGFYLHGSAAPRRRTVDPVCPVVGATLRPHAVAADEIALRCGLAMINEALSCHDGVLRRDGDVGAILRRRVPAFRGGPFRHADVLGMPEVLRRMRSLEQRFRRTPEPAPLLVDMARSRQTLLSLIGAHSLPPSTTRGYRRSSMQPPPWNPYGPHAPCAQQSPHVPVNPYAAPSPAMYRQNVFASHTA